MSSKKESKEDNLQETGEMDTPEEVQERQSRILEMLCTSGKYRYYLAMAFVALGDIAYLMLQSYYGDRYGRYFLVPFHTGKNWLLGMFVYAPLWIAFVPELRALLQKNDRLSLVTG
ncbi:MAG: hypothetical protein RSB35_02060 [Eubacterium sp.]